LVVAVAQVIQFRINPGRNQEFNAQVAEAKKLQERLGGRVRVWQATAAGPNTGLVSYVIEHPDLAAFAAFSDKLNADSQWQAFVAKVFTANPSGTLISAALVNEITPSA
jgi:hypothetical protein